VTCPRGATPESSFGGGLPVSCSDPAPAGDSDGYCCIEAFQGSTCWTDVLVPGCAYPSLGFSCAGSDPASEIDPGLLCKGGAPDPASGHTPYCCLPTGSGPYGGGGCVVDATIACEPGTDGVDCAQGGNPEANFPGYVCSAPGPQPDGTDGYCCATGFTASTCATDTSIPGCGFPSVGFSCAGSDTPTDADPSLTCSAGVVDQATGDTLFCCQ
jgi:hypothetical protein